MDLIITTLKLCKDIYDRFSKINDNDEKREGLLKRITIIKDILSHLSNSDINNYIIINLKNDLKISEKYLNKRVKDNFSKKIILTEKFDHKYHNIALSLDNRINEIVLFLLSQTKLSASKHAEILGEKVDHSEKIILNQIEELHTDLQNTLNILYKQAEENISMRTTVYLQLEVIHKLTGPI